MKTLHDYAPDQPDGQVRLSTWRVAGVEHTVRESWYVYGWKDTARRVEKATGYTIEARERAEARLHRWYRIPDTLDRFDLPMAFQNMHDRYDYICMRDAIRWLKAQGVQPRRRCKACRELPWHGGLGPYCRPCGRRHLRCRECGSRLNHRPRVMNGYPLEYWQRLSIRERVRSEIQAPFQTPDIVYRYRHPSEPQVYCSDGCWFHHIMRQTKAQERKAEWLRRAKKQLKAARKFLRTGDPTHLAPWQSPSEESTPTSTLPSACLP